ncbi:MAG: hypothetical protein HY903_19545 [Deltaproteobacteria bacterium]|nr:hypothetical protein [Deltaproteobacteria bacterium]
MSSSGQLLVMGALFGRVATVAATAPEATVETPPAATAETTPAKLARARVLFADLEYDAVIPLVQAVLQDEGAAIDLRLDAYYLLGSSLAIANRASEAEAAFRFLLRGRPELDLPPAETPPKILRVFRNVKVEEDRIRAETRALEHRRIVDGLKLLGSPPPQILGGEPIHFRFQLRDPTSSVAGVRLDYRKTGSAGFASLPLSLDATGGWIGSIPASWTENDDGMTIEVAVFTLDRAGEPLLVVGAPPEPAMRIAVTPGTVAERTPIYTSVWFWAGTGLAVIGSVTAAVLVYQRQTDVPASDLGALRLW